MILNQSRDDPSREQRVESLFAELIDRGFDDDAARLLALGHADPHKPFHQMTVEEVRAGDHISQTISGPDIDRVKELCVAGDYGSILVRAYIPEGADPAPVVVWLHGGGWVLGDLDSADTTCRHLAAEAKAMILSVDYRKAPEFRFPVAVEECYAVVDWAASHGAQIGGDPSRIAVGGDSAGGTMAAAICLMARARGGPRLAFQLLVNPSPDADYGRPSMRENAFAPMSVPADIRWFLDKYLRDERDLFDERAVPASASSHADLPRAFVLTAEFDILRDGGEAYGEALRAAGVQVRAKRYAGVAHGFFNLTGDLRRSREAMTDAIAELRDALGTAGASDVASGISIL
jgi:acetyl esterase